MALGMFMKERESEFLEAILLGMFSQAHQQEFAWWASSKISLLLDTLCKVTIEPTFDIKSQLATQLII